MINSKIALLAIVTVLQLCFPNMPLVEAQSCSTTGQYIYNNPTTNNYLISGSGWWTDPRAWVNDGKYLSQTAWASSGQYLTVYNLDPASTQVNSGIFPSQTYPRLAVVGSAAITSDETTRAHVYWGGQSQSSPDYPALTRVDAFRIIFPSGSGAQWIVGTVASGRRILSGDAATCGPVGNNRVMSIRAFGRDYGTDANPSNVAANATVFDYYYAGTGFGYGSVPSTQTYRDQVTAASAGTLCMYAGGISLSGQYQTEVSVLNVSAGVGQASWFKWQLSHARRGMASVWIPASTGVAGKVFYAGGQQFDGQAVNYVDIYDIGTDTVTTTCLPSGARWQISGVNIGDRFAAFAGGIVSNVNGVYTFSDKIDVYDTVSGNWLIYTMSATRGQVAAGAWYSISPNFDMLLMIAGGVNNGGAVTTIDRFKYVY